MRPSGLSRLVSGARARRTAPSCDICAATLEPQHGHVVDLASKRLCCACRPCTLAFIGGSSGYRTTPTAVRRDDAFGAADEDWDALGIPVGLFFLMRESRAQRWAVYYPGPSGATQGEASAPLLEDLARRHAVLRRLTPDVEALLVRRHKKGSTEAFVVPLDHCYRLTALIRADQRGVDGGEARRRVDEFFAELSQKSDASSRVEKLERPGGTGRDIDGERAP